MRRQNEVTIQSRQHFREVYATGRWNPVEITDDMLVFADAEADDRINRNTAYWFRVPPNLFMETAKSSKVVGVIYHVSRCGSTLCSNLLNQVDGIRSLNEASLINNVLINGDPRLTQLAERLGPGRNIIIKTSSWNVNHAAIIDAAFPASSKMFIYRDPFEVLASFDAGHNSWIENRSILASFGDPDRLMSDDPLVRFARCLLAMLEKGNGMDCIKVRYTDILKECLEGGLPVAFGYATDGEIGHRMVETSLKHSKRQGAFLSDTEAKQSRSTELAARLPQDLADGLMDQYDMLERRK